MNSLENRLQKVERKLFRYQLIFCFGVLVIGALLLTSFKNNRQLPELIQARKFQLVDDNGTVLIELGKENGNGAFTSYTPSGKKLIKLFTSNSGCGAINSFNNDGDVVFKVTNNTNMGGYMCLYNKATKEIVELGTTDVNSGYLNINNKAGDKLLWLTSSTDGMGYFSIFGNGNENIKMNGSAQGGRMSVFNNYNTRVCYMGSQENNDGFMSAYNSGGLKLGSLPN